MIIQEKEVARNLDQLAQHWVSNSTFLFVPDRAGVGSNWLRRAAEQLPTDHQSGCFGLLTSGSTGDPKLIVGNKQRSEGLSRVLHDLQESEPVAETICALPLSYSYAFVNQWLWAHVFGRRLLQTPGFSKPNVLQAALLKAQDAMFCMVGSQVALIRYYFPEAVFPGVIRLHFAGGRFPQEQLEFIRQSFPNAEIFNNYGCAEAMPRLTMRHADDDSRANHIGHPLPGIEIKSDSSHKMHFQSPFRAVAYIDEKGFQPISDDDWVPTGDLGQEQPDGSWMLFGRANDVFNRHGEKISIPRLLSTVKTIWEGNALFYRETDATGEDACVLVLSPHPTQVELRTILMEFRNRHPRTHWPLRIESVDRMPLLPNGKMDSIRAQNSSDRTLHWRQRI